MNSVSLDQSNALQDDASINSDDAFNSEDEEMYGHYFHTSSYKGETMADPPFSSSSKDDTSGSEYDDEDEDDDDDKTQFDILSLLNNSEKSSSTLKSTSSTAAKLKEGTASLPAAHSATLTLSDLIPSSSPHPRPKTSDALSAKPSSALSDRLERAASYAATSKAVSLYLPTVRRDRAAETLDFRPKGRVNASLGAIAGGGGGGEGEEGNEFERRIREALERGGGGGDGAGSGDEGGDDLGEARLTLEEVRRRHAELSKVRSLMFHEEIKRHKVRVRRQERKEETQARLEFFVF